MRLVTNDDSQSPVFFGYEQKKLFMIDASHALAEVEDAKVSKGKPDSLTNECIEKELSDAGLPTDLNFSMNEGRFGVQIAGQQSRGSVGYRYLRCGSHFYQVVQKNTCTGTSYKYNEQQVHPIKDGEYWYESKDEKAHLIDAGTYTAIASLFSRLEVAMSLFREQHLNGLFIAPQFVLDLIGEGSTVTAASIMLCRAVGENRPRFWIGDMVTWESKGNEMNSVIASHTKSGAGIRCDDGKRRSVRYNRLTIVEGIGTDSFKDVLSDTVLGNFEHAVSNSVLYKSKIQVLKVDEPFLAGDTVRERKCAHCPNCDMMLAEVYKWNSSSGQYKCVMCSQFATLIHEENDVGIFILAPSPSRNNFNIHEARCCNNCGHFEFEVGREGKRCTGYCPITNQTVVAHSTCDVHWIPDEPDKFANIIKNHVTNLKHGLKDRRNVERDKQNIDDFIYRQEDHDEQASLGERMKGAYSMAYQQFKQRLIERAAELEEVEVL